MTMKRVAILVVGSALSLFIGVGPAAADNGPHVAGWGTTPDACAACHRAHTAKAPFLLKQAQPSVCFTCHGSAATGSNLDVEDGVGYSGSERSGGVSGALRGGGFKYALIDSANPSATGSFTTETVEIPVRSSGAPVTSAHSVDGEGHTAWGNGEISATENVGRTIDLTCGSCHDPHGNGNYRILRPTPTEAIENLGHGDTSHDVVIPDVATKQYTTTDYGKFAEPNNPAFFENISKWCSTCHTRYLAPSGSATTASGDAVFAYRHTTEYLSHRPQCITCHVAHGSDASMTGRTQEVTLPNGNLPSDVADSRLLRIDNRGVCQACHRK
jgi:predicted CXXCH cytochrome family protein